MIRRTLYYFGSSIMMVAITLATFPFATLVLGPADYGAFALASAYVAIVAAFAVAAFNYSLATHLAEAGAEERAALISTAMGVAVVAAVLSGALAIGALVALSAWVDALSAIPRNGFLLLVIASVLATPWVVAENVLVLDGRAKEIAASIIMQAICRSAGLLAALFVFDLGALSLFIGTFAGGTVALAAAALVLRQDLGWRSSGKWLRIMLSGALSFAGRGLAELLHIALQSSLISSTVGMSVLGLFTHGRQYQVYTLKMYKAVAVSLWPVYLAEARDVAGDFSDTIRTWRLTQSLVIFVGLFFATLGKEFIDLLSHGQFTGAYVFAALLLAGLLIQTGARQQYALLIAHGQGNSVNNLQTISFVAGIVLLVGLIFDFGMVGVMVALFAQWMIAWVGLYILGRRIRAVPFSDHLVVLGTALIAVALMVKFVLEPTLAGSAGLFAVAAAPLVLATHREFWQLAGGLLGLISARGNLMGFTTERSGKR